MGRAGAMIGTGIGLGIAGMIGAALLAGAPTPQAPADLAPRAVLASGAGPLRLAVLGTSLSARATWPEALAEDLSACLAREVVLIRIARPGANVTWGRAQLDQLVAAAPDIVLIEFAINDADLRDGLRLAPAQALHRDILGALQAAGAVPVLMTMNPARGLRGLVRPGLARHYAGYHALAQETGAGLVDFHPRWRVLDPAQALPDGLHPPEALAKGVMVPVLRGYLGRLAGAECGS